ncbi:uncharacterized protein LACBIDRAFT_307323 [Laccaria bicolor S238N-H82]|uniref:Predicted protein n=1 Tax=Laccaria bicolor (strain S238N-H82 / ATCC MYA-4686) TaxID=486041 RepID=B0DPW3_LACBS|nr:uncharacterized protein LACBIDRAFT_307323 [Laccaria bicolor S238N-H82]EDR03441.1 predicted protein [Laccaria bicolor S238N-H82]|eukprot:XP_001885897.1 predicted protein [Laccaria bicolor S238N-H82]
MGSLLCLERGEISMYSMRSVLCAMNKPIITMFITEPDKSRPVFVHALTRCPRITLPDGATPDMEKGHISLTPYSVVEQLVARGEVKLI